MLSRLTWEDARDAALALLLLMAVAVAPSIVDVAFRAVGL